MDIVKMPGKIFIVLKDWLSGICNHCEEIGSTWSPDSAIVWHMKYVVYILVSYLMSDEPASRNHPTYSSFLAS